MPKNVTIEPQYLKDLQGKKTHVYLPINAYNLLVSRVDEYEKLQKEKGIGWVRVKALGSVTASSKKKHDRRLK